MAMASWPPRSSPGWGAVVRRSGYVVGGPPRAAAAGAWSSLGLLGVPRLSLGVLWGRTGVIRDRFEGPEGILAGPRRILGSPWASWESLGEPLEILGGPRGPFEGPWGLQLQGGS